MLLKLKLTFLRCRVTHPTSKVAFTLTGEKQRGKIFNGRGSRRLRRDGSSRSSSCPTPPSPHAPLLRWALGVPPTAPPSKSGVWKSVEKCLRKVSMKKQEVFQTEKRLGSLVRCKNARSLVILKVQVKRGEMLLPPSVASFTIIRWNEIEADSKNTKGLKQNGVKSCNKSVLHQARGALV